MSDELDEGTIIVDDKDQGLFITAPPYTSDAIKKIVTTHISNIRKSSLILEGVAVGDIEYDNPEVHPQMMMDNLKDASVRLQLAIKELQTLSSLTDERREQLESKNTPSLTDFTSELE